MHVTVHRRDLFSVIALNISQKTFTMLQVTLFRHSHVNKKNTLKTV